MDFHNCQGGQVIKNSQESKNSFFEYVKLLLIVGVMSCIAYFFVFNNMKSSRLDRRIASIKKQIYVEANQTRSDIIRSEEVLSKSRVKQYARNQLGMVNTRREDYVIIR